MGAAAWIVLLDMLGTGGVTPAPTPTPVPPPGAGAGRQPRKQSEWWTREYVDWPYEQRTEPERRKRMRRVERSLARAKEIDTAIAVARREREQLAESFRVEQQVYEALDDLLAIAARNADVALLRREFAIEVERTRMAATARQAALLRADDEAFMLILTEIV